MTNVMTKNLHRAVVPFVLGAHLILSGCAYPTPYQRNGLAGGYSEEQIGTKQWIVRFEGNMYTSSERAENMAMLRVAELALEKGYRYYSIDGPIQHGTAALTYTRPGQVTMNTQTFGTTGSGYTAQTTGVVAPAQTVTTPATPLVAIRASFTNEEGSQTKDARAVASSLRSFVVR